MKKKQKTYAVNWFNCGVATYVASCGEEFPGEAHPSPGLQLFCIQNVKEPSLTISLPIARGRIAGIYSFPKVISAIGNVNSLIQVFEYGWLSPLPTLVSLMW